MHGSGGSLQETAAVRLYLDESGGPDPGTPQAIVGGMLINYSRFLSFEDVWEGILERHGIAPPLHMKEFARPDGALASIPDSCRFELFTEIAEAINYHKIYSISAITGNDDYRRYVSKEVRDKFGVYGMGFLLAATMNHKMAQAHRYTGRIPFILDTGNPKKGQIAKAHEEMILIQRQVFLHVGGLHFEDDRDFGILQAADVIAWGARRRASKKPFGIGLTPIERILDSDRGHVEMTWEIGWMNEVNENLKKNYLVLRDIENETANE